MMLNPENNNAVVTSVFYFNFKLGVVEKIS